MTGDGSGGGFEASDSNAPGHGGGSHVAGMFCHGCVTAALQCPGAESAKAAAFNLIPPDVALHTIVQALPQAVVAAAHRTVPAAVAMASPRFALLNACARCS